MNNPPKVPSQSAILVFGGLTALLLLVVLMNGLRSNLRSQLDDSAHQVSDVARSVSRAVRIPLRGSANSITFVAEESSRLQRTAPEQSDTLLRGLIAEILRRQPQIVSIDFKDSAAPSDASATPVSAASVWVTCDAHLPPSNGAPCFGAVAPAPGGAVLSLATPLESHGWITGNVRVAEVARSVTNLGHTEDVFFDVVDAQGNVIAQGGSQDAAATVVHAPTEPWWISALFRLHDPFALQAEVAVEPYPFKVVAGMEYDKALAPWRQEVFTAGAFYVFYLLGFACLLGVMYRATTMQRYYIKSLRAKTQDLQTAQRVGRTAIWTLDAKRFECTDEAGEIFGLPDGKSTASMMEFLARVCPPDRRPLVQHVKAAWENREPLHADFRIEKPDGTVRRLSAGGQVVIDKSGATRMTGTVVDVTEQWEARQQQAESEHRFQLLFEHNPLPFWVFDISTLRFLEVNAAAVRAYGYTREEFLTMSILDLRDASDHAKVMADVHASRHASDAPKVWVHRTRQGKTIEVRVHSVDIVFNGRKGRLVLAEDITAHMAGERELAYLASHDLVTKLPNQHALFGRMDALITEGARFDVAYLQLLGMDAIADTFGIHVATGILQGVATRLLHRLGDNEFLASVTQEAFVWVAPIGRLTYARLQEEIVHCFNEPVYYEDTQHQVDVVIGVASHPRDGIQSSVLVGRAALAAHAHLRSDQSIHYFEPALAQQSKEKLHFAAHLRRAVRRHEFEMHFQPITSLPDKRLIALEALIRWPQADGTLISPSTFIPVCEESGLIVPLGQWVLNQVAKACLELKEAGFENLPIGMNISPAELRNSDLVANLRAIRSAYSLSGNAINIELTESCLIEHRDKAVAIMRELRSDGVVVALDDFGTGFSSLSYLRDLPIDILKIDQAFIRNVDWDARSATICDAIIALGKSLKVRVIAEGIERSSQYRWLHQHGCDGAQGFYLGKPQRLPELLAQWSSLDTRSQ
ncbi:GGDEF domain-containing phosphodiesterase [Dyella sp. 2HG41-7]|uniref:putative bifunctional diguanylate cyclase/phosphodiesterase n=1 Tax=Dyella sp. 2HG41-7 TaxID=2883239 RepID=UPI001F3742DD|nr:GGDEF domain-containing phosphodiesterase [Dyella sp. 2HG41-7]